MKEKETIITKVEKMLRLAKNDGATEGEVENALHFAKKLMDANNIEHADLFLSEKSDRLGANIVEMPSIWGSTQGSMGDWIRNLAWAACYTTETKFYMGWRMETIRGKTAQRKHIVFYGFEDDTRMAVAIFEELRLIGMTMARARYGSGFKRPHLNYCRGYAQRLAIRAGEMDRTRKDEDAAAAEGLSAQTTAIILVKENAVKKYAEDELNLTASKARSSSITDPEAFMTGDSDGKNVAIGAKKLNGGD